MKKLLILLSLCLLLSGCPAPGSNVSEPQPEQSQGAGDPAQTAPEPLTPASLDALLALTNARRAGVVKPASDESLVEGWNARTDEPPADLSGVTFSFAPEISETEVYSLEQVREDVALLFYFYEIGYGPYFHFGGPEAFDAARAAVLADMEALPQITAPDLQESLIRHLSFVGDAHFAINGDNAFAFRRGYLSERAFLRDTAGFADAQTGERLEAVDGARDFADSMVLCLSPQGTMVYRYLVLAEDPPGPVELAWADGATLSCELFSAHEAAGKPENRDEIVSLAHMEGIPVITVNQMGFPHAKDDLDSGAFLGLADEMKDEPVLIIDLRANGGGNTLLAQMFYERLTGSQVTPNHYSLTRLVYGREADDAEPDPELFYYVPGEVKRHHTTPRYISDDWKLEYAEPRRVVERDQLLIVLTSKSTASSADNFTDVTFNIGNSLVIGCNTTGMMTSSASFGVVAPNTGTVGQMGIDLTVYDPAHFQEGVGVLPDLWVSGDALECALALARTALD